VREPVVETSPLLRMVLMLDSRYDCTQDDKQGA
jgi:hypothetical protein